MIRGFIYLLLTIVAITLIRTFVGLIGKAVEQLFDPEKPQPVRGSGKGKPTEAGELVQDPVCGIYVSTQTKLHKTVAGKTYHFCSEACMSKFKG